MNNKVTLVIDGNWLMMSRFFMVREQFRNEYDENMLEKGSENLADLMAQSISVTLRSFAPVITNIIFVSDNRSWRKEYPIPACIKSTKYKGTREQADTYNWNYIYKSINTLSTRIKDLGLTVSNNYGIEGDDWCWWWSRYLNSIGTNVILWTSDEDVKQLIQRDEDTGAWTGWYEKSKGLVLNSIMEKKEKTEEDDLSFFMSPLRPTDTIVDKIERNIKVSYINPCEIINKKIYIGDSGDNILPVFTYTKNNKQYKATQKDWENLFDFGNKSFGACDFEDKQKLAQLYNSIYNIKSKFISESNNVTPIKDFIEHVIYNRKMVWLDGSQIPDSIQGQMGNTEYFEATSNMIHDLTYNWKIMSDKSQINELKNLLEGEEF